MRNRIFLGLIVFFVLFLVCYSSSLAYYNFLSPECNIYLENLKEKFRMKQIVLEKKEGIVWAVILPKNDGVETKEVRELVYNDETGKPEGVYTFTDIIIKNPQGWTQIIWGPAAEVFPYDVPRICIRFDN